MNANKLRTVFKRGFGQTLQQKVLTKASYVVPHNLKYRPSEVVDALAPSPDLDVDLLQAGIESETFIPSEFRAVMLDKGYDHFDTSCEPVRMYSNPVNRLVARLPEGRLVSDNLKVAAYITRGNKLLTEVSLQYINETVSETESPIFKRRFFNEPVYLKGRVFAMIAGGVSGRGNYFHWLIDTLPRLQLLAQSRFRGRLDKVIVPQYDRDFQQTTLRLMGIDESQIIECDSFTHYQCEELLVSSHPRGRRSLLVPDWVFEFYSELKHAVLDTAPTPKRIYVTRKDTTLRGIRDEDRLIEYLKQYDFEPVTLADYDFDGKVNLFNGAEMIISAHGAGLTNLLFSHPGARLLELFTAGFVDPVFLNLSERKQIQYNYLIFEHPQAAHEDAKGQYEDILVDYEILEEKMKEFMDGKR